jgi:hypothetical protein
MRWRVAASKQMNKNRQSDEVFCKVLEKSEKWKKIKMS